MKKNVNIKSLFQSIYRAFSKYSLTIFIITLVGGLSLAVLILNSAIEKTSKPSYSSQSTDITSFDQTTIDRVNQLIKSDNYKNNYQIPSGRVSPFAE